jgi:hypothetical protein
MSLSWPSSLYIRFNTQVNTLITSEIKLLRVTKLRCSP